MDHAAISGKMSAGRYSQTLSVGNFYILLSLSGPTEEINLELGRNALLKIEETVTETPEISPLELLEIQKEGLENEIKVGMGVIKIENEVITAAFSGDIFAYIFRQNRLINLFSKKGGARPATISGKVTSSDLVVLGTAEFFEAAPNSEITKVSSLSPIEIRDSLTPIIEGGANADVSALIVRVEISETEEGVVEAVPEEKEVTEAMPEPEASAFFRPKVSLPTFATRFSHRGRINFSHLREGQSPQNLRRMAYLLVISVVLLISLIAYQLRSRTIEARFAKVSAMEKKATETVSSAKKLSGLNDSLARQMVYSVRADVLSQIETTFGKDFSKDNSAEAVRARKLLAYLDSQIGDLSHIYKVTPDLFYDFSLLKSGASVISAAIHKNQIVALDLSNGAVYSVDSKTKGAAIVGGSDKLKSSKFGDFAADKSYVWTSDGIYVVKKDSGGTNVSQLIKPSDKWGEIKGLKSFAGNIYLLDKGKTQIWKYQGTDSGFSDISNYINSGLSLDFSKVLDFAIDGSVFVLSGSGNVVKFTAGAPEEFSVSGLPDQMKSPGSIFTSEEAENIYIWDGGSNAVFVTDKKGAYLAEYQVGNAGFPGNVIILADESVRKVFLVSGGKIFAFSLR